jgi:hypothetical protein
MTGICKSLSVMALLAISSGCVTEYQSLSGLTRPVALDIAVANFERQRILIRCFPGDYLDAASSQKLCRSLQTVFTNQGAEVDVEVPRDGDTLPEAAGRAPPDLVVDLRSRLIHRGSDGVLMFFLSLMTMTVVPMMSEQTFAQEVIVRDPSGFLLANETYEARLLEYVGVALWAVRKAAENLDRSGAPPFNARAELSNDFYAQLCQLTFHARMRRDVMRGFAPAGTPPPGPSPAVKPESN